MSLAQTLSPFSNEPLTDFSLPPAAHAMQAALDSVSRQLGKSYPLILGGKRVQTRSFIRSINPSLRTECVGVAANADRTAADRALDSAAKAFQSWARVPQEDRVRLLLRMAEMFRRKKMEFMSWLVLEVGKNWSEADADVAEAIDFLEFNARQALVEAVPPTPVPSERNVNRFLPLGVVVVVPPWNFPLAILVGMTMAAVVTGNTVVLKPSSQSPVIAAKFMELAEAAGLPPGVINLLTGAGGRVGDYLVQDERTRMIAFTGSKNIGLRINALAAQPSKTQRWVKRVIAEMGGKNAIVVDESADLAAAVDAVFASAFGYQGQKCSACSRAYVHAAVYDDFVSRLREKMNAIRIGPARVRENYMGPVISAEAMAGIQKYIALGKKQGRILAGGQSIRPAEGFYLAATAFEALPRTSALLTEEIFGPVLGVVKAKSFRDALDQANRTDYGLTGAVFATDPAALELARQNFFCGNLYLNRKCTGAWVGGHPFGGFNLSGTDSKAGGPDYLMLFRQAQSVSERI